LLVLLVGGKLVVRVKAKLIERRRRKELRILDEVCFFHSFSYHHLLISSLRNYVSKYCELVLRTAKCVGMCTCLYP
jgi:hypothetical protein